MKMGISVDAKALQQAIRKSPEGIVEATHQALLRSAIYAQKCFRRNLNANTDTGSLKRSVRYHFTSKVAVEIAPEAEHAPFLEYGTHPHYPPIEGIRRWAKKKGINPYALQRSIGKRGTRAHPYLDKTFREVAPYARKSLDRSIGSKIKEIIET